MRSAHPRRPRRLDREASAPGFTLVEMMVTLAVIGLAMSVVFGFGEGLLPRTRLKAAAKDVAMALESIRVHAQLTRQEVVFVYDFDENGFEAYYPQDRDDENEIIGPGKTPVMELRVLRPGVRLRQIVLANAETREDGKVSFTITPRGRIPPHDVILDNPEHPDTDVYTVRVDGLTLETGILPGVVPREVLDDAMFR